MSGFDAAVRALTIGMYDDNTLAPNRDVQGLRPCLQQSQVLRLWRGAKEIAMTRVKGRTDLATHELKKLAKLFAEADMPEKVILEHLNTLEMVGEKPLTLKSYRRWHVTEVKDVDKAHLVQLTYRDVMFLRGQAYEATAKCEINRYMYIVERAYWWGLYVSALHIMLRQAMAVDAAAELPPQFIMDNLDQFYADIRAVQQMTPPLARRGGEETVEQLNARMKAFEDRYAKGLKLPEETL